MGSPLLPIRNQRPWRTLGRELGSPTGVECEGGRGRRQQGASTTFPVVRASGSHNPALVGRLLQTSPVVVGVLKPMVSGLADSVG